MNLSSWKAVRLAVVASVSDGPHETPEFVDAGIPFLSVDNIVNDSINWENPRYITREAHETYSKKCRPQIGDVLLSKAASIGKVALVDSERDFNVWSPLAVIRPSESAVTPEFMRWTLLSGPVQAAMDLAATSNTQRNLAMSDIASLRLPLPPLEEQRRIADFLDDQVARIDKLAKLLDEQQILIKQSARRIIDAYLFSRPDVAACPMKYAGRISYGLGQPPPLRDVGIPIIRATNIDAGAIRERDLVFVALEDLPLDRAPLLELGEILIVRSGALTGDSALITDRWAGSAPGYDLRFTPDRGRFIPEFVALCLLSETVLERIWIASTRAAQPHLNAEELGSLCIPFLEPAEQSRLSRELSRERESLESARCAGEDRIRLLAELKRSLISAAVSGEFDVSAASGWGVSV